MKSSKLIMGGLAALGLTAGMASAQAEEDRDAIAERLKPVGQLCLQGEDCGTASAAGGDGGSGSSGVDGESIYGSVCAACHDSGAAGAPVRGEEDAWAERVDKGWEELLANAINGIGAMPAKGGNPNLSDEEMEAVVAYMLDPVMDVPEVGGDDEVAEEVASNDVASEDEAASDDEASATAESGGDSGLDGEALYAGSACVACHASGAAGAPVVGDPEAWAERLDKGVEELYASAINGIGAMPPKGGAMALSDEEVQAIVDYMVAEAQ